jgi:hypothetical protein
MDTTEKDKDEVDNTSYVLDFGDDQPIDALDQEVADILDIPDQPSRKSTPLIPLDTIVTPPSTTTFQFAIFDRYSNNSV